MSLAVLSYTFTTLFSFDLVFRRVSLIEDSFMISRKGWYTVYLSPSHRQTQRPRPSPLSLIVFLLVRTTGITHPPWGPSTFVSTTLCVMCPSGCHNSISPSTTSPFVSHVSTVDFGVLVMGCDNVTVTMLLWWYHYCWVSLVSKWGMTTTQTVSMYGPTFLEKESKDFMIDKFLVLDRLRFSLDQCMRPFKLLYMSDKWGFIKC